MIEYEEFRKVKPLWVASDGSQPLAQIASLIGPREFVFINGDPAAISVREARALRDWLNNALPEEPT